MLWTDTRLCEIDMSMKIFVSQGDFFWLDGTCHPQAILTNSMSKEGSLAELLQPRAREGWPSLYALSDPIVSPMPLEQDVPAEPPWRAAFNGPSVIRQLFVSRGPTRTQLHRDRYHNVYLCV